MLDCLHDIPRLVFALIPPDSWQKICSEISQALAALDFIVADEACRHGRRASDIEDLLEPLQGVARSTWQTFCMLLVQSVPLCKGIVCTDPEMCLHAARSTFVVGAICMTEAERTRAEQTRTWNVFVRSLGLPDAVAAGALQQPFVAPVFGQGLECCKGLDGWPRQLLECASAAETRDVVLRCGLSLL